MHGMHGADRGRRLAKVCSRQTRAGVAKEGTYVATRMIAVTSTFSVASGSSTFHPNDISWS